MVGSLWVLPEDPGVVVMALSATENFFLVKGDTRSVSLYVSVGYIGLQDTGMMSMYHSSVLKS